MSIKRIGLTDNPIPSTRELAKYCYPDYQSIIKNVKQILNSKIKFTKKFKINFPSDQPNKNFMGPF